MRLFKSELTQPSTGNSQRNRRNIGLHSLILKRNGTNASVVLLGFVSQDFSVRVVCNL